MERFRLPGICYNCRIVFGSGFTAGVGSSITTRGCKSDCPRCGSLAPVPDNALQVIQDGIRLFSGSDFTKQTYENLGLIVEDLRLQKITKAEAISRADQVIPSLGREFREWATLGIAFIALMVTLADFIVSYRAQQHSNRTLEEIVVEAVESAYEAQQPTKKRTLSWDTYLSSPKAKPSDFIPAKSNGLNRKRRRALAAKRKKGS
ncbi:hypothetical protein [Pseudotabrizicola algicola]|uniref:Uncharacterized protein n=1 Tax=Pseudotabrizicola algicola TaxID=2709381 RepID=A0A6B3RPY2_9RHOB|nr:hypothetical protein [Pseudotabrizicola algicola]NEX45169.1 hypothetical protein [Pseudotabrizicola algicola]